MKAAWDLAETQRVIEHSAVRLLRSPNCALTLTFLHRAFKEHQAIAVPDHTCGRDLRIFSTKHARIGQERISRPPPSTSPRGVGASKLLLKKFFSDRTNLSSN
jgi:hypothetical protein